jgi:hypothetical protein
VRVARADGAAADDEDVLVVSFAAF